MFSHLKQHYLHSLEEFLTSCVKLQGSLNALDLLWDLTIITVMLCKIMEIVFF